MAGGRQIAVIGEVYLRKQSKLQKKREKRRKKKMSEKRSERANALSYRRDEQIEHQTERVDGGGHERADNHRRVAPEVGDKERQGGA